MHSIPLLFTQIRSLKDFFSPLPILKFIYSEKATKFCEISTLLFSVCTIGKSKVEISQNFVAFPECTNFTYQNNSKILPMTGFLLGHALKVTCLGFVCLRCNQPVFNTNTGQFFSKRAFEPGTRHTA